jgi:hypothetical protein
MTLIADTCDQDVRVFGIPGRRQQYCVLRIPYLENTTYYALRNFAQAPYNPKATNSDRQYNGNF